MEILSADFIVESTIAAENKRKNDNREKAMKVLEEQNFNERVQIAAAAESWRLGKPIEAPSMDIAMAMKDVLIEAGYEVEVERNSWESGSAAKVKVSWHRKQNREASIDEKYARWNNNARIWDEKLKRGEAIYVGTASHSTEETIRG